jgi:hypothetical protein
MLPLLFLLLLLCGHVAADRGAGLCLSQIYNNSDAVCSAGELEFMGFTSTVNMACIEGSYINVNLMVRVTPTGATRYDIGIIIPLDAGNGTAGVCANWNLTPITKNVSAVDAVGGMGPFYDAEPYGNTSNTCGDIQGGVENIVYLANVTILCRDSYPRDGFADLYRRLSFCCVF